MESVLQVTSGQLNGWVAAFFWPFVRILALISAAPMLGETVVPRNVKVALAMLLTLVVAPTLAPMPEVPLVSAMGLSLVVEQVLIGAAMGFVMRLVFALVQAAGEFIGLQMGLSFATFFDPTSGGSTQVMGRLLNLLALLIFMALDGHLSLISLLAGSFQSVPVAFTPLGAAGWWTLVSGGGQILTGGLLLSLPIVATLLAINLAMGILNRVSPQFSIFAVGFPMTLLAGLALMQVMMQYLVPFLAPRFAANLDLVQRMLLGFAR